MTKKHSLIKTNLFKLSICIFISIFFISGCNNLIQENVVVYTSVDKVYSQEIFDSFYKETGIKVLALYDVEASKTTGLVNRLINEKNNPKADVFWNGEILQTLKLNNENILEPYGSKNTVSFNKKYIDSNNMWTAFGLRARILLVNNDLLEKKLMPNSWLDIEKDSKNMNVGISKPMFGTSSTHIAALYNKYGREFVLNNFEQMKKNGVKVLDGNSNVRDMVVSGALTYGLTDTDDALIALKKGANVSIIFPDQLTKQYGTLAVPNSVALIKNGPNTKNGKIFIDYLLKKETINKLVEMGWIQIKINNGTKIDKLLQPFLPKDEMIKFMDINYNDILNEFDQSQNDMTELFLN
ncbi:extracellular solute-binding protein [Helicovermis profundi]|uniref:Extracellular solute-binding protein n=1 Tax=Helicovermis profundi TaxID=3065157 RepID=A0AAU9EFJ7_9FIRM|nr:extracellular solute-binding protein [Clostridia bacterium S502]